MILVFDLDDTLYSELNFFTGGLIEVSQDIFQKYGIDEQSTFIRFNELHKEHGREFLFDRYLLEQGIFSKLYVKHLIKTYRFHTPKISLFPGVRDNLESLTRKYPLYIVTDGHKIVQKRKIDALAITSLFRRFFLTNVYGTAFAKPSLYCFDRIKRIEATNWEEIVYVGDNPLKDFINLNKAGAQTIRVLQGPYSNVKVPEEFNAKITIESIKELNIRFFSSFRL